MLTAVRKQIGMLWAASPALTATGFLMLLTLAGCTVGVFADARIITGAPAWLKPAKFAISIAIFVFTAAWFLRYLRRCWLTRWAGGLTAATLLIEQIVICAQAARGVTSHFNVGTPLDAGLFAIMGLSIAVLWLCMVAFAVMLWRTPFQDAALGWALRIGMVISLLGAASGGVMVRPTPDQRLAGRPMKIAGAHTVGAPDGGPGLPGVGWSRQHGDLRVPHFFALHAIQLLPLLALFFRSGIRLQEPRRLRLLVVCACAYAGLCAILEWQALAGQAMTEPGSATVTALGLLGATVAAGAAWALRAPAANIPRTIRAQSASTGINLP